MREEAGERERREERVRGNNIERGTRKRFSKQQLNHDSYVLDVSFISSNSFDGESPG